MANKALVEQLTEQAWRFEFFQAVRLIQLLARERSPDDRHPGSQSVGTDQAPSSEAIRFRALPALSFPAGEIASVTFPEQRKDEQPQPTADMTVTFLGLTGPSGVLPQHYTSLLIERCHVANKDHTLRDFFDLFNHRTISLFYRAWEKYRFPYSYEQAHRQSSPAADDLFTFGLYCLVGLGTPGLRDRQRLPDETILYYGGHFAHHPRSAVALQEILADHLGMDVTLEQFVGRWLYLPDSEQSALPSAVHPAGLNSAIGRSAIIGKRVWDVRSKFRVKLGPTSYAQFLKLTPAGDGFQPLCELIRFYVGMELSFDVQVVLRADEVPPCQIGQTALPGSRLGWNTWLKSGPFVNHPEDAIFHPPHA